MDEVTNRTIAYRSFPWDCPKCQRRNVYPAQVRYGIDVKYDGQTHHIELSSLEAPKCRNCGELVFTNSVGDQVHAALRAKLGLLQPAEIHDRRTAHGLTALELSQRLGLPDDAIERFEEGLQIQTRAQDRLLRVCFAFPNVREALDGAGPAPTLGLTEAAGRV